MKQDVSNVFVIAQKEFADNLWSPRFISLVSIFTLIVFSFSYRAVINGRNIFELGFLDVAQIIAVFLPLLGIALGFDTIVKERKSASLNILLTHPVYRDNIITGKILGAMITLALVVSVAVASSVGTMLIISGVQVSEFKTLVKHLHSEGFSVLMDVVYNHVSQYDYNPYKLIDKKYYFNLDSKGDYITVSGCGNDFNTAFILITFELLWTTTHHLFFGIPLVSQFLIL